MRTKIQKWGNSLAVRIPKAFAADVHFEKDTVVEISLIDDQLVIKPVPPNKPALEQLLAGVTKENLHGETGTGEAVGNEIW